ncbi:MAG: hypothetical protein AB4038_14590, partial [Prochloraceae cyanobacterium]
MKQKKELYKHKTAGIEPTIFWRIAEDIPKSLSWVMMTFSIIIPLICWFVFATYSGIDSTF